jgi:hypothetical protein
MAAASSTCPKEASMKFRANVCCASALLLSALPALAVTPGQVQTFDDAVSGWVIGGGGATFDIPIEATGGPAGAGDRYMELVATGGSGPGSRLSAQNFGIWTGDYIAAGVTAIGMAVQNFGPDDLHLRLVFVDGDAAAPLNVALSTEPVIVPAGSGWRAIQFDVSPGSFTAALGSVAPALESTDELRIFHNPDPFFIPFDNPAVAATLGVDNITAVPEPAGWAMMLAGLALVGCASRVKARWART